MGLDEVFDSLVGGTTWGLGVAAVAGAVLLVGKGGRPLAKRAIKGYLVLSERAREPRVEASEQLQGIYAEARAEREETHHPGDAAPAPRPARKRPARKGKEPEA